jgi:hypothetical protein
MVDAFQSSQESDILPPELRRFMWVDKSGVQDS